MGFAYLSRVSELRAPHRLSAPWLNGTPMGAIRPERFLPIGVILTGLILSGFGFSRATEDPFHAWRWAMLSCFATVGLALALAFKKEQGGREAPARHFFPSRPAAALVAGYLLFTVLSLFPAVNMGEAIWQLAQSAGWSAWFLLILRVGAGDAGFWTGVRRAAVASALLGSVFAAGQYWSLWAAEDGIGDGPGGLHGNRNLLASAQFLLSPWILWALIADKGFHRIAAGAAWIGFCYVLAITQCRAVWAGCLAMAAVAAALHLAFGGNGTRGRFPWPRPSLLLLALPLAAAFFFHGAVKPGIDTRGGNLDRAATMMDAEFDSNAQRLALWNKTLLLIGRNPIAGVGAGNWKIALPETGMAGLLWSDMEKVEVRPYNDWLWTFSEIGIPGGLCWLGLWAAGLFAGVRALRRSIAHPEVRLPVLLLTAGLAGFGVISCFDFPRERAEHMAWYAAGLAFLFAVGRRSDAVPAESASVRSMPGRFPRAGMASTAYAGLLLLAGAAAAVSGLRWMNETLVHAAMNAHRVQDWPALIEASGRLDGWICNVNPAASPMAWQAGIAKYQLGDVAGAERSFREALRVHPAHAHALYDLSVCRLAAGDTAGAETLLRRTLDVSPGLPEASINLAVLSLRRGDRGLARAALDGVGQARRDSKWNRLYRATALEGRNPP